MEIARRYLSAYGPATPDDFARWWGLEASHAKKLFRSLGEEIETVDVEGWQAWALISTLGELKAFEASHSVRLIPQFDAYVVGISRDCVPVLSQNYKARVYRPQGWISAVVLVDGRNGEFHIGRHYPQWLSRFTAKWQREGHPCITCMVGIE